jgi:phosphoribosylaminoimidazole-succinocarboxamide synthase
MKEIILETKLNEIPLLKRGKVRDIYDLGEYILLVATDRISAFDVVLPNGIPDKGRVLTEISLFWFRQMEHIIKNHIVAIDIKDFPKQLQKYDTVLRGRSMLVRKTMPMPVECVVRGYLAGSGWKEYKKTKSVCDIALPEGLIESSRLSDPIFTPSTKEEEGHDLNISFEHMKDIVGDEHASFLRKKSLDIYSRAREIAEKKGIIIADTKFEFGRLEGDLILIDEILTPDSSRFWSMSTYTPGKGQDSYDKQIVRDYLLTLDWNNTYPGPQLPEEIVDKATKRYQEILEILTK